MKGRILLAGVLGGIAMFGSTTLSHMSPLGNVGIDVLPRELLITETLRAGAGNRPGLYLFPALPDAPASTSSGFLVYYPTNVMRMTAWQPLAECAKSIVQSVILAFLMTWTAIATFEHRVALAAAAGIMVALTTHGSYFIWYRFPLDFVLADAGMTLASYLIAGAVIAAALPRLVPRRPAAE